MKQVLHNMMLEPHVVNQIATHIIDSPALTVYAAMIVGKEVEKGSFEQTKMKIDTRPW